MNSRKIPKWLLWTSWLRMMFFQMTSQSFDRGYTNAFTGAMSPILRYLYKEHPDADQRIREGLNRTRNYYLCEQSFSGVAFAIDRKSTRLNSSHTDISRMPSSA